MFSSCWRHHKLAGPLVQCLTPPRLVAAVQRTWRLTGEAALLPGQEQQQPGGDGSGQQAGSQGTQQQEQQELPTLQAARDEVESVPLPEDGVLWVVEQECGVEDDVLINIPFSGVPYIPV